MTVGAQATKATIDQRITDLSLAMRNIMNSVSCLSTNVNGQGNGLTTLEGMGYNPTDAAQAQAAISYLNTVAGVYFGTATQATLFNFNQQLSQYWAAQ